MLLPPPSQIHRARPDPVTCRRRARPFESGAFFYASVDLNTHQIEAAVFALRSPLSKGVLLAPPSWAPCGPTITQVPARQPASWPGASSNPCKCGPCGHADPDDFDLPPWLRRLLHRPLHLLAHPRHAPRQTRGRALRATGRTAALQNFWATRTACGLRAAASFGGDVRGCGRRRGARPGLVDAAGGIDAASRQILSGPGTSLSVKDALTSALHRDPVDTCNDAELLAMVLGQRADQITATARAVLDVRDVIKRAQNNAG